ncbi:MAG TPA: hypothetical protein VNW92_07160 [Polyangiaceae bacterium]|jgi:hypothetical protein|nr:hypothetical protein [Polyangiaceae bacterium]
MKPEEVFEVWAPSGMRWSPWVKPVLFALLAETLEPLQPTLVVEIDDRWLEPPASAQGIGGIAPSSPGAVVVDLPGPKSVAAGLRLATLGYRPVPLFNALPGGPEALVDVAAIQDSLASAAELLRGRILPVDAPPAFLLDSQRRTARHLVAAGRFDNRSVVLSTDFPSGDSLAEAGVRHVTLLRSGSLNPGGDLLSVLAAWNERGIAIQVKDTDTVAPAAPCSLPRWPGLSRFWFQTLGRVGLRRQPSGEFGGTIPSSG